MSPSLVHRWEESGKAETIWKPGPTIRECCVARGVGLAIAAWWWEVERRFEDLREIGLPDPAITQCLLEQQAAIEDILAETVPRPTSTDRQAYLWYREDIGLERRRIRSEPPGLKKLGLSWPCSLQDLKAAILKVHPDHGGDPKQFREYYNAYTTVRKALDRRL